MTHWYAQPLAQELVAVTPTWQEILLGVGFVAVPAVVVVGLLLRGRRK